MQVINLQQVLMRKCQKDEHFILVYRLRKPVNLHHEVKIFYDEGYGASGAYRASQTEQVFPGTETVKMFLHIQKKACIVHVSSHLGLQESDLSVYTNLSGAIKARQTSEHAGNTTNKLMRR